MVSSTYAAEAATVSIISPVRNEAAFIEENLNALLTQDFPSSQTEIIIMDGMSTDGTRDKIKAVLDRHDAHDRVRVVDNPTGTIPAALNIGLRESAAPIIIRVDGHCRVSPDYVTSCVEALKRTGADCVGGAIETVGSSPTAQAIALAQSSRFGVGGVAFRTWSDRSGFVDTVPFGAYRADVFARIGGFDEELVRNQDDELNFRLLQSGGTIWLDSSIQSLYYSRLRLKDLWRQYFGYGMYKVLVMHKRKAVPSLRHLIPGAFVLALTGSVSAALLLRNPYLSGIVAIPYLLCVLYATARLGARSIRALSVLPLAFFALHFSYGLGTLAGAWRWRKRLLGKRTAGERFAGANLQP